MAWSLVHSYTKKDGNRFLVHTSFRKNGKPTSATCGTIYNIDKLKEELKDKFDDYINAEANRIYNEWKESISTKHTFTYTENKENEDSIVIRSSQIYLRKLWNDLGLDKELKVIKANNKKKYKFDLNEVIFYLVSKQIIDSSSKLQAYNDKDNYLLKPDNLTLDSLYDSLTILADVADSINLKTYKKSKKYLKKDSKLYFYDVTSVNLSKCCKENDLIGLKKGKEGIFGPIIQIGYLCDEWGLLVGLLVFKGNRNEQSTLEEQITKIYGVSKIKDIVICTDAGLCSIKNKRYSERIFKGYITTQPLSKKKVPDSIRDWAFHAEFPYNGEYLTKNQIIEKYHEAVENNDPIAIELYNKTFYVDRWFLTTVSIDKNGRETISSSTVLNEKDLGKKVLSSYKESDLNKPKKGKTKVTFEQRLIISFSLKYYFAQLEKLEEEKEKALSMIDNNADVSSTSKKDYRRFLKVTNVTENGEVVQQTATAFLEDEYNYEKSLCGLYCQATNLDDSANTIYRCSRERWIIEYSFRTAKTNLEMGKIYLRDIKHVIGHFEICFLAQVLLKVFTYKIYNKLNLKNKLGKVESNITQDKIITELVNLQSLIKDDDKGETCILSLIKKNEINKLFAEVFDFSLTMSVRPLQDVHKFLK